MFDAVGGDDTGLDDTGLVAVNRSARRPTA